MLRWRLLLGAIFIALMIGLCWLDETIAPGMFLLPVTVFLGCAASSEILWLFAGRNLRPVAWVVYLGNLMILGSNALWVYWPLFSDVPYPVDCPIGRLGWPLGALGIGILLAFVGEMRRYEKPGETLVHLALAVFSMVYVGVLLSFVFHVRMFGGDVDSASSIGIFALGSMLMIVKACDIGAYTVGRLVGRHKMAPVLSPGKTLEGAFGGLAFASISSLVMFQLFASESSQVIGPLVYGLVLGGVGMLGDLSESLIKRDMGRKDSSSWMPGFGGVLDILDSVLLAAPVAYLCWATGMVHL